MPRSSGRLRRRVLAPVAVSVLLAAIGACAGAAAARPRSAPSPGAPGIGDRLFPTLGNGGYDVRHYDLAIRYETSDPSSPIDGTVKIHARATQSLSRFDLDFAGDSVGTVQVNGRTASWTRSGEELVITPRRPIWRGSTFVVRVSGFTAHPSPANPEEPSSTAFFTTPDGSATAPQPNAAHFIYPSNDHPRDKASFLIRMDVPAGETAVANGELIGRHTLGDRTVWTYWQPQPMATELTQLVAGHFDVTVRGRHDGVSFRDVTPPSLTAMLDPDLASEIEHMQWLQNRLGRYPFDLYGSLVVNTSLGFALETQTLSLFDIPWFRDYPEGVWSPAMLHELTHQWFGDSVSPWEWSDVWLNEGHATWYELHYAAEKGFLAQDTGADVTTVDELAKLVHALGDQWRAAYGPVARPVGNDPEQVFNPNVYYGGALVLFALQQEVGDATFRRIEHAWLFRYRNRSASTDDFIALASHIAHRDLTAFLTAWLYGTTTPPMPGHPDWTVAPAQATAKTLQAHRREQLLAPLRRR